MTDAGLKYFDLTVLDHLEELIEANEASKKLPVQLPEFIKTLLIDNNALESFNAETKSSQKNYIGFIMDAKQEETKIRRCHKVIGILAGEKNNL